MYQSLKEDQIVARGLVLGAISDALLDAELRKKLRPLVQQFRQESDRAA